MQSIALETTPKHPGNDIAIIRVHDLVNRFGAQTVHDGLNLEVRAGEVIGIVGGSGTGKSVLLRTIIGLNRPVAGTIEVFGQALRKLDDAA
ncbi:MAG TPA: ATP-binding cassette domain-containing protein, partial [Alphaproteobacteria bacterium]|nr:ATP-binding cassette domain-containing protein [Alphaproteobacteria bacterium]